MFAGAVKEIVACALPPVAVPITGASGTVTGIDVTDALALPCPATFTAATRKSYDDPFVSPLMVPLVFAETPSANVDHVELAVNLYSST